MNYLKEINSFYDRLETNPLSSSAIALWHALMTINNKAGWINEFAVAASVLCVRSGLKDSMFKKARNELQTKGYVSFKSRNGNQSALYRINSLQSQYDRTSNHNNNLQSQYDHNGVHNGVHNSVYSGDRNGVPLIKQNNTKQNETINSNNSTSTHDIFSEVMPLDEEPQESTMGKICKSFEQIYGRAANPVQLDKLVEYHERDHIEIDAITYAIEQARTSGNDLRYALGILDSWAQKNILTLEAAKEEARIFQERKSGAKNKGLTVVQGKKGYGNRQVLQDKYPAAVQRQIDREQLEQPTTIKQKQTIMDDPELKELYESLRGEKRA
ncbi:DnaD domain-containing protein [Brevibacillus laterosporus]|uniref:DnaD domain-containing protein n=1 Tax=Brevibacillus laterosporus TaxID=1465 RepID=UPI003D1D7916